MYKRLSILLVIVLLLILSSPLFAQDSLNISMVSSMYHYWDTVYDIKFHEDHAYFSTDRSGIIVLDISDPSSPFEAGSLRYLNSSRSLEISDENNLAYITNWFNGFSIYDISDPADPFEVGSYDSLYFSPYGLEVADGYAYMPSYYDLVIVDISDPSSPAIAGSLDFENIIKEIHLNNNYLYIRFTYSVKVFDISNLSSPEEICQFNLYGNLLETRGNYLYAINDNDLIILDVSNPELPIEASITEFDPHSLRGMTSNGDYIYLSRWHGLTIMDVSDPSSPVEVSDLEIFPDHGSYIWYNENYVYMSTWDSGVRVFDVSDPSTPLEVSSYGSNDYIRDIEVSGSVAFLLNYSSGELISLNINHPYSPFMIGSEDIPISPEDMLIEGDYAYIAHMTNGLSIVDVSNPVTPSLEYQNEPGENLSMPYSIAKYDNYVYMAGEDNFGHVYDVSVPCSSYVVSEFDIYTMVKDIAIHSNYAYVAGGFLQIFDLSDPSSPIELCTLDFDSMMSAIDIHDHYLYMVAYLGGDDGVNAGNTLELDSSIDLYIFDISDPISPVFVNSIETVIATDIDYQNGFIFLAGGASGLKIIDVRDPMTPIEVGYYDTPGVASSLAVNDEFVYVSDEFYFEVFDCSDALPVREVYHQLPREFAISSVYPNPFNMFSFINVTLPQSSNLRLTVYNELGQEVRILSDRRYEAGNHQLHFDGSGLASGAYFIKAVAGDFLNTHKVVLLK